MAKKKFYSIVASRSLNKDDIVINYNKETNLIDVRIGYETIGFTGFESKQIIEAFQNALKDKMGAE